MDTTKRMLGFYLFPLILICSIVLGGLTGYFFGSITPYLKPLGEIFLNLIFTCIVPLIFFSITSAITRLSSFVMLGKIIANMTGVFLFTSILAALFSLFIVSIFPPAQGISLPLFTTISAQSSSINFLDNIANIFTVSEFNTLLSHHHILALIIFSIMVGIASCNTQKNGSVFIDFLNAGHEIFMNVFQLIMYVAPIGFFAYFSVLIHEIGPQLMQNYLRITIIYYVSSLIYFFLASTFYAYLAGNIYGVKLFWGTIFLPLVTAIATCSSAASIPANLTATKKMGVAPEIYETIIPLGSMIHKDGSVIGGVFKIAFLFGVFHLDFTGSTVLLTALGVSLLVGTVMGAIPSGGMLGELLILNIYGFPPSVLIIIAAISIIIDPLATMISVTTNSVSCMLIARLIQGKKWLFMKNKVCNEQHVKSL